MLAAFRQSGVYVAQARQQFQVGEYLFREGDAPGAAFLLESGQVEISIQQGGSTVVLSHLGEGELIGEMAVIDEAPRSASARATQPTSVTRIEREQINERLAEADPIVGLLLQKLLARYRTGLMAARGQSASPSAKTDDKPDRAESELTRRAMHKFRLERQLMSAIENDELSVVYQPIYDVANDRVGGFEALTRWAHPDLGPISPSEFIALAEETSLIMPVGQYALRKACEAIRALPNGFDHIFIAVNTRRSLRASMSRA
jgi:diguanylate cyclase